MRIALKSISLHRLIDAFVPFCICSILSALPAGAQGMIDFETVPGGSPADQLAISSQYLGDFGVTFSLEGGGTPFLEARGAADSGHGFYNYDFDSFDIESASHTGELGNYFLRFGTTTFSPAPGPVLVITYSNPVSAASAEIWDLDAASGGTNGHEAWTISARDVNDVVIDTIVSPNGIGEDLASSLNGKPWTWSFNHANADIHGSRARQPSSGWVRQFLAGRRTTGARSAASRSRAAFDFRGEEPTNCWTRSTPCASLVEGSVWDSVG